MSLESRTIFTGGSVTLAFRACLEDRYGTPPEIAAITGVLTVTMHADGDSDTSVAIHDGGIFSPSLREIVARAALRQIKAVLITELEEAAQTYEDPARVASHPEDDVPLIPEVVEACVNANAVIAARGAGGAYQRF